MPNPNWLGVKNAISRGWIKNRLTDMSGSVCLMGGVMRAEGLHGYLPMEIGERYANAMAPVIREQFGDRVPSKHLLDIQVCVLFNNHPDTTKDDVLLVVEKVMAHEGVD